MRLQWILSFALLLVACTTEVDPDSKALPDDPISTIANSRNDAIGLGEQSDSSGTIDEVVEFCVDSTAYEECSKTQPAFCDDGKLVDRCETCGCLSGFECTSSGSCKDQTAQTEFKMAFVLLVYDETDATSVRLDNVNSIKDRWPNSFHIATKKLATMDSSSDLVIMKVDADFDTASFDWEKYSRKFYENNPDDYDFISFYTAFEVEQFQTHLPVQNRIEGIGMRIFDDSTRFGSEGRLKGINFIGDITIYEKGYHFITIEGEGSLNALKHETGHQWCCYIGDTRESDGPMPLIQQGIHWSSFVNFASINEGYIDPLGSKPWVNKGANNFEVPEEKIAPDEARYSHLTLYLMGLLPAEEVPKTPLIIPTDTSVQQTTYPPNQVKGTQIYIDIDDIISREGSWKLT